MDFLFLKPSFEQLFVGSIGLLAFIIIGNLFFWTSRFFWKKRKLRNSPVQIASHTSLLRFKIQHIENPVERKILKRLIEPKFIILILTAVGLGIVIYAANLMFNSQPVLVNFKPGDNANWDNPREPILIEFDRPVDVNRVKFNLVPEIDGDIQYERSFNQLPFTRKILFYPKKSLDPGNRIYLYVNNFFSLLGNHERYGLEAYINSYTPPAIEETSIQDAAVEVPINSSFKFTLDKEPGDFADFDFAFEPAIEFDKKLDGKTYTLEPKTTFPQSAPYKITVSRTIKQIDLEKNEEVSRSAPELIKTLSFTTVTAPDIKSFAPVGGAIFVTDPVKIVFNQEMLPDTVIPRLSVNPPFDYTPVWTENNTVLTLQKAKDFDYAKEYQIKIAAGANGVGNTTLENDFSFKFTTIGAVKVTNVTPSNGSYGNGLDAIVKVTFDQEVDHDSAQQHFSVSPNYAGTFSWNGGTMLYTPNAKLNYYTRYTYTISSGVKSTHGQDSTSSYTYSFVTLTQNVSLNVPLYAQSYNYSCNITAASMILGYKGINMSQISIYNDPAFPKQNVPHQNGVWGDPDAGYVGDLNGPDGYGVHWGPISSYLAGKGVSNRVQRNMSAVSLAKELEQGHPAIVWVWNGINGTPISWKTPSGKTVNGVTGMHSWVVVGYTGTSDNPTTIVFNDPWGSKRSLSVSSFNYYWSFYSNTAVIIN